MMINERDKRKENYIYLYVHVFGVMVFKYRGVDEGIECGNNLVIVGGIGFLLSSHVIQIF